MTAISNYPDYDALGLAELVRTGQVSAPELLREARARLAALNPQLNAVICAMDSFADSLAAATDTRAPFCGVPFLVKDLMLPFAGFRMANGSAALKDYVPEASGAMAERITAVGLVTFGKTNTPELGLASLTAPAAFGETRNPWDLELNSGGSSGGSSAAVAARIVPMAYSSDGGGSIRIPASYCGIFGFKPSRGLNRYEDWSKSWCGATVSHVSTVSVRDSAAWLDVASGCADAGYSTVDPPPQSCLRAAMQPPPRLRIGLITRSPIDGPVHDDCVAAALTAAKHCEQLGHRVEPADWNFDGKALMRAFLTIVFSSTTRDVADMARLAGVPAEHMPIELNTRFLAAAGAGIGSEREAAALDVWKQAALRLAELHGTFDVILTPTTATPPLASHALDPNAVERLTMRLLISSGLAARALPNALLDLVMHESLRHMPFTPIANMTGQPAMSLPLYWDAKGLPHGAQFMAAEGKDRLLFQLAAQLEAAHPWRGKVPGICRGAVGATAGGL